MVSLKQFSYRSLLSDDRIAPLESVTLPLFDTMVNLVARVSNRVMIGVPGCRDKKFLAKQVTLATTVISLSQVLNWFPQFMKPCVSNFLAYKYD